MPLTRRLPTKLIDYPAGRFVGLGPTRERRLLEPAAPIENDLAERRVPIGDSDHQPHRGEQRVRLPLV